MDFAAVLLSKSVLIIAGAIFALLWGLGRIKVSEKKKLSQVKLWRRLLPIIPLALGVGFAFMEGVVLGDNGEGEMVEAAWGEKVLVGIWAGLISAHGRKITKRLFRDQLTD